MPQWDTGANIDVAAAPGWAHTEASFTAVQHCWTSNQGLRFVMSAEFHQINIASRIDVLQLEATLETMQNSVMDDGAASEPMASVTSAVQARPSRLSLPPKGSCWYCEKPVDSVRRFCGKDCTDAYDEEAEYTK